MVRSCVPSTVLLCPGDMRGGTPAVSALAGGSWAGFGQAVLWLLAQAAAALPEGAPAVPFPKHFSGQPHSSPRGGCRGLSRSRIEATDQPASVG